MVGENDYRINGSVRYNLKQGIYDTALERYYFERTAFRFLFGFVECVLDLNSVLDKCLNDV